MPTQRSFLGNFLAAFRAHQQQLPKPGPSLSASAAASQTIWTSAAGSSTQKVSATVSANENIVSPRPIHTKATAFSTSQSSSGATTANAIHPATTTTSSSAPQPALSTSGSTTTPLPGQPAFLQHNMSPQTHLPRSTPSPGLPSYPTPQEAAPWGSARRARRGSDSSSDSGGGFREVRVPASVAGAGAGVGEKWFVGGRTAAGEEKYYALTKIRRDRSSDRISTDQLSL